MHRNVSVGLEPPDSLWQEATILDNGSGEEVTVALETLILELEDGWFRANLRMRLVLCVSADFGDGRAVDFDGEGGREGVHCFC